MFENYVDTNLDFLNTQGVWRWPDGTFTTKIMITTAHQNWIPKIGLRPPQIWGKPKHEDQIKHRTCLVISHKLLSIPQISFRVIFVKCELNNLARNYSSIKERFHDNQRSDELLINSLVNMNIKWLGNLIWLPATAIILNNFIETLVNLKNR